MPKRPAFWFADHPGWQAAALGPLAGIVAAIGRRRMARKPVYRPFAPVIGVGNLLVGGQGKTPVTLALADKLTGIGRRPIILSRGYGGRLAGPVRVDPADHDAADVGDEPLLLARAAPCWVARDRAAGARQIDARAMHDAESVLLLDDAHQNRDLAIDLRLLVIDGADGFGNGQVIPAGPLREPLGPGIARADAVILIGPDRRECRRSIPQGTPVLEATLQTVPLSPIRPGGRVFGFAGIGRPEKFREGLAAAGLEVAGFRSFADHHRYRQSEIEALRAAAAREEAFLVTTEKDAVRIPAAAGTGIHALAARILWHDEGAVDRLLSDLLG